MMRHYKKDFFIFFLFFIFIITTSCSSVSKLYITLDVLRPAQVEFKREVSDLLIVNNTIALSDTLEDVNNLSGENIQSVSVNKDSITLFYLNVLADQIRGRDFFSSVQLLPQNIRNDVNYSDIKPIQYKDVYGLSKKYNSDVILSLDFISAQDGLKEYFLENIGIYLAVLEMKYESLWSVHYPNQSEVDTFVFKDTLYWETEAYSRKEALENLPSIETAALDGVLLFGLNTVDRFIPYWDEVDRYFYSSKNKYMLNGVDSISVKNWEGAISDWEKVLASTKNKSVRANAYNNIAIVYEILGDYDRSIEYIDKAIESMDSSFSYNSGRGFQFAAYKKELLRRKSESTLLEKQLGN